MSVIYNPKRDGKALGNLSPQPLGILYRKKISISMYQFLKEIPLQSDEKEASKKNTQFKTRVSKPSPNWDQNMAKIDDKP